MTAEEALDRIVDYLYDEEKHWRENGRETDHIWNAVLTLDTDKVREALRGL